MTEPKNEFYGQISKNGFLPVSSLDAPIKKMMRSTAFFKKSRFPCIKIEKMPDKASRKSTALVRHFI